MKRLLLRLRNRLALWRMERRYGPWGRLPF